MTTNRGFSLRFDQMREGNPAQSGSPAHSKSSEANEGNQESADSYGGPGHMRNLCFLWPDGKKLFLNYAYLVSCAFEADGETNTITLAFTSHTILLKGYGLESLFDALMDQLPRVIDAQDARYRQAGEAAPMVTEIEVSIADK